MKIVIMILILSSLAAFIYYMTRNSQKKLLAAASMFVFSFVLFWFLPLSYSTELKAWHIIQNILPAMLFLYALDLDWKRVVHADIGCSCKMGAKRYWLIVVMAFAVSLTAQLVAHLLVKEYVPLLSTLFGLAAGLAASKTPLRCLNGTAEVATTMLYLLSALAGVQTAAAAGIR